MNTIKTSKKAVIYENLQAVREAVKAYDFVLLIQTDKVVYLRTADVIDMNRLIELRAHTKEEELHLVKMDNRFIGRVRRDGEGEDTEYMDEKQCLWGTAKSFDGDYSVLYEERGISLRLPICVSEGKGAYMTVRSYLDREEFVFTDYRIVNIEAEGGAPDGQAE